MEPRYFQYVSGDEINQIKIFDKVEEEEGILYVCFKDGSRCNEQLIAPLNEENLHFKVMAEIEDPKNPWTFKEEWVGRQEEKYETGEDGNVYCVVPFIEGRKKTIPIPPRKTSSKFGTISNPTPIVNHNVEVNNNINQAPVNQQATLEVVKTPQLDPSDPVFITLSKSKKVETDIDMTLTISLPPRRLYDVVKESFEEGDKKFIEYIIKNMDVEYLKEMIGNAVHSMYENENKISI